MNRPSRTGAKRRHWVREGVRRFLKQPVNLAAFAFLSLTALSALGADFLASDKPILCRLDGQWHFFPNLVASPELTGMDNAAVEDAIARRGGFAILPPVPYGPYQIKVRGAVHPLEAPSFEHPLGTDREGRDVLARIIHGARSAEIVSLGSMILATLLGVIFGSLAAYFGGVADRIVRTVVESLAAFPALFLILAVQGLLGAGGPFALMMVIAATRFTEIAQVTRAETLRIANEEYVDAARALGLGHLRILTRYVLPNAIGPITISAAFGVASSILIESTLSFLGYGVLPPTASWGGLIADAFENDGCYWLALFPGAVLTATVLCVNLVGEGLRDALDPGV